jgi:hypothetical protein
MDSNFRYRGRRPASGRSLRANASMERARGSQEAGCRTRGVEFAPDSPLEGDGFEPSVPREEDPARRDVFVDLSSTSPSESSQNGPLLKSVVWGVRSRSHDQATPLGRAPGQTATSSKSIGRRSSVSIILTDALAALSGVSSRSAATSIWASPTERGCGLTGSIAAEAALRSTSVEPQSIRRRQVALRRSRNWASAGR